MKKEDSTVRRLLATLALGFLAASLSIAVLCQTGWSLAVGGPGEEKIHDMAPTSDGGFVLAGSTGSFGAGGLDLWVLKFDAAGNLTWDATYGGAADDKAYAVTQTVDGGYAVAGYTDSFGFGGWDLWVLKLDGVGAVEWQKVYGGTNLDWAYDITQTQDGGYAVCGTTYGFGGGRRDAWFLKLDAAGGITWQKTIGKTSEDWAYRILQTEDLGYITCGLTESGGGGGLDAWAAKLDSTGTPVWQRAFGNLNWEYLYYIRPVSQGGYIAAGAINGIGGIKFDLYLLRLDDDGAVLWQKSFSGTQTESASYVEELSDGGFCVAGLTNSKGAGNYDGWLIRLDPSGAVLWQKVYGTNKDDRFATVLETPDGYVISAYSSGLGAGGPDAWIMSLNRNGALSDTCVANQAWSVQPTNPGYAALTTNLWVTPSSAQSAVTAVVPGYPDLPEDLCQSTCEITCEGMAAPETGMEPLSVQFTSTVSTQGCDGTVSLDWDFGDGSPGSTQESAAHEYTQPGIYTWTLTVEVDGFLCTDSGTVEVEERRCVITCSPTADPTLGFRPLQVGFAAGVTATDCIGDVTYDWDFGDGTAGSQEEDPDHLYQQAGVYTWTLTVSADGQTCVDTGTVTVEDPPCTVTCQALALPDAGTAPLDVQFTATITSADCTGDPVFSWDFGDGNASAEQNPMHTYGEGAHTWSFTVVVDGVTCSATGAVAVGLIPGDCDGSGSVSIGEVQKAINMFLEVEPAACGVDCNGDGSVSIGEVQKVINAFLGLLTAC